MWAVHSRLTRHQSQHIRPKLRVGYQAVDREPQSYNTINYIVPSLHRFDKDIKSTTPRTPVGTACSAGCSRWHCPALGVVRFEAS